MTNSRAYYLEELLKPYGEVQASKRVAGEMREIDVFFAPSSKQLTRLVTVLFLENPL